jgi:predicted phage terminase large subunit-like protein
VFWLSWWWLRKPSERFLTLSGAENVATRDSWKMRTVITSEWYGRLRASCAAIYGTPDWSFAKDQNEKVNFVNTAMGGRQCFTTGGSVTGSRGSGYLVDDPHQIKDVLGSSEHVAEALGKAHDKIDVVLPSRVNDQRTAWRAMILQRSHEGDAAGRFLARGIGRAVILPMHAYDLDDPWRHPEDPRAPGELLDPVRLPEVEVKRLADQLESQAPGQARAQLEQRPIPAGGGTFKRIWTTNRYDFDPQRPPTPFTEIVVSTDATFKATKKSAFVSIQAWARRGWVEYYLLGEIHERLSYVDTRQALRDFARVWRPNAVLVEEKANGAALIDDLRSEIPALIPFVPDPYGDKIARAQLTTPMWQAGAVWLPKGEAAPFVLDFVNELCAFPAALDKDRVDAMSQVFLWWAERRGPVASTSNVIANLRGLLRR